MQQLEFFEVLDKPTSVCPVCEKIFEKIIYNKKFCSKKCRIKNFTGKYKEKIKEYKKQYDLNNKEKIKQYRFDNKEKQKEFCKKHYINNKEKYKNKAKEYYFNNREKIKEYKKQHRITNIEKYKKYLKKYILSKKEDVGFKIKKNIQKRIWEAVKKQNIPKTSKTKYLLGCDWNTFKDHIQSKFKEEMAWENYGLFGWHIDHIIPCASFDLTDPEQQKKCFHYTNLQPLWWNENLSKGAKILNKDTQEINIAQ